MTARRISSPRSTEPEYTGDPAILVAQTREDLVVGDRVVRFRTRTRVIHWGVALTFLLCLFTGLPIWSPVFGWLAHLFGGLQVCRWVHPWTGITFSVLMLLQFLHWAATMRLTAADRGFVSPKGMVAYLTWRAHEEEVGKFNGGQKVLFWLSCLAAIGMLLTGFVLWYPNLFGETLRQASWLLHDVTFILFTLMIIGHIYLGIVEPGTFNAMIEGTVSRDWAELNHPAWYRDVTRQG